MDRAVELGCETVQVFSRSPRGGKPKPLDSREMETFRCRCKEADISPLCVHVPYFINLGAEKEDTWDYSLNTLILDLYRAQALGAAYVVTHLGRYKEDAVASLARSVMAVEAALQEKVSGVTLLLEVSAGQGHELGATLEELAAVAAQLCDPAALGFCLDTAHLHASGYDIASADGLEAFMGQLDQLLQVQRLGLVHLNDAVYPRGHRRDRHAGIGEGDIGLEAFGRFISHPQLRHLPGILETPAIRDEDHLDNLNLLRKLRKTSSS